MNKERWGWAAVSGMGLKKTRSTQSRIWTIERSKTLDLDVNIKLPLTWFRRISLGQPISKLCRIRVPGHLLRKILLLLPVVLNALIVGVEDLIRSLKERFSIPKRSSLSISHPTLPVDNRRRFPRNYNPLCVG